MDLYIYYKVDPAIAADLAAKVTAMQAGLDASHQVSATLRRRPGEQDGRQTWMEVYADVAPGFNAALSQAVAEQGIAALIDGPRHTEIFVELQACV
jgi:hypothetical protein